MKKYLVININENMSCIEPQKKNWKENLSSPSVIVMDADIL